MSAAPYTPERNEYARARYQRRRESVDKYKRAMGCQKCGYREHASALEMHHRPGEVKLGTVGSTGIMSGKELALIEEMAKCDVLCANCHRVVHCG